MDAATVGILSAAVTGALVRELAHQLELRERRRGRRHTRSSDVYVTRAPAPPDPPKNGTA